MDPVGRARGDAARPRGCIVGRARRQLQHAMARLVEFSIVPFNGRTRERARAQGFGTTARVSQRERVHVLALNVQKVWKGRTVAAVSKHAERVASVRIKSPPPPNQRSVRLEAFGEELWPRAREFFGVRTRLHPFCDRAFSVA